MCISSALRIIVLFVSLLGTVGWAASAAQTAAPVVKDFTPVAANLFNNMRTPAALIGGAIVPVGLLSAPKIEEKDSSLVKTLKKANVMLAIASLLSEMLAITYSTIAINKLAEVKNHPLTEGVDELLKSKYELAWLGTNIHFLTGLMGFGLLVGAKPYFLYGPSVGHVTGCWTLAGILLSVSVVNRGIALGDGTGEGNFASNLFTLVLRYAKLIYAKLIVNRRCVLPQVSVVLLVYSVFLLVQSWLKRTTVMEQDK